MADDTPNPPTAPLPTRAEDPVDGAPDACPNCGAGRPGAYCSACGQKNAPLRQPLSHFLGESFTEYFGLDGRLWRSLGMLLLRPGRLTQAYLGGQRVQYLRPVRLYLTATILFFFLLSVLDPVGRVERTLVGDAQEADSTALVAARLAVLDSVYARASADAAGTSGQGGGVATGRDRLGDAAAPPGLDREALSEEIQGAIDEAVDSVGTEGSIRLQRLAWQREMLAGWPPDSMIRPADLDQASRLVFDDRPDVEVNLPAWMAQNESLRRLRGARTETEAVDALSDFIRGALGHLPTVMFLLLPVFALLLKAVYARRGWYYSEHLVFGLHTHAFAFLVFAVVAALLGYGGSAGWARNLSTVLVLVILVYFYVAQKRVYGQGWVKTGLKAVLLGGIYGFLVLLGGLTLAFVLAAVWS